MLAANTKREIKEFIFDITYDSIRDMLRDYVMDGGKIVGINEYTDQELVDEYLSCVGDEEDELYLRALAEIEAHKALTG